MSISGQMYRFNLRMKSVNFELSDFPLTYFFTAPVFVQIRMCDLAINSH